MQKDIPEIPEEAPLKSPKVTTMPDMDTEEILEEVSIPVSTLEQPNFTQPPEVNPIFKSIGIHSEKENRPPKLMRLPIAEHSQKTKDTEEILEEVSIPVSTLEQPNFTQPPEVNPIFKSIGIHSEKENRSPKLMRLPGAENSQKTKDKRKFRCEICDYATPYSGNLKIHTRSLYHKQNIKELEDQGFVIDCTTKGQLISE